MCYAEVCWWLGSVDHLLSPNALGESLLVFLLVVQLRSESRIFYSTNFYPSLGCSSKGAGLLRGKGMRGGCQGAGIVEALSCKCCGFAPVLG